MHVGPGPALPRKSGSDSDAPTRVPRDLVNAWATATQRRPGSRDKGGPGAGLLPFQPLLSRLWPCAGPERTRSFWGGSGAGLGRPGRASQSSTAFQSEPASPDARQPPPRACFRLQGSKAHRAPLCHCPTSSASRPAQPPRAFCFLGLKVTPRNSPGWRQTESESWKLPEGRI